VGGTASREKKNLKIGRLTTNPYFRVLAKRSSRQEARHVRKRIREQAKRKANGTNHSNCKFASGCAAES
jgi:hypothetical protein